MIKAYMVKYKDEDWIDFTHADNRQEAKILFWREWGFEYDGDFINIRAKREPLLDNIPLIGKNIVAAGYNDEWINCKSDTCECDLCNTF